MIQSIGIRKCQRRQPRERRERKKRNTRAESIDGWSIDRMHMMGSKRILVTWNTWMKTMNASKATWESNHIGHIRAINFNDAATFCTQLNVNLPPSIWITFGVIFNYLTGLTGAKRIFRCSKCEEDTIRRCTHIDSYGEQKVKPLIEAVATAMILVCGP